MAEINFCIIRASLFPNTHSFGSAPEVVVKDTVGAGDAFMAGLIVGLTSETDARKVLTNACRLGAFVASHYGATPLLPAALVRDFYNS